MISPTLDGSSCISGKCSGPLNRPAGVVYLRECRPDI
jgi:hypothetical protein